MKFLAGFALLALCSCVPVLSQANGSTADHRRASRVGVGKTADLSAALRRHGGTGEMTILFEGKITRFQDRSAELQIPRLRLIDKRKGQRSHRGGCWTEVFFLLPAGSVFHHATAFFGAVALSFCHPERSRAICSSTVPSGKNGTNPSNELSSRLPRRAVGSERSGVERSAVFSTLRSSFAKKGA